MKYISTRGQSPALPFDDVVLAGLAPDGGLYMPERWPTFTPAEWRAMTRLDYPELACRVLEPYTGPPGASTITRDTLRALADDAYGAFHHRAAAPLVQLDRGQWVMELFHGPTLAFKDFALQLLGRLFDAILEARDQRITVVGATSGDTGSAAIEACRGRERVEIFILHPQGRVSEVQRRQMTTVDAPNVHNLAVEGTFDDCQDMVKAMFADTTFRQAVGLSAVNSINWARVAAQIVYYVYAALALGAPDRSVRFCVPTGNFGNVLAGFCARSMGLPIESLVVASNENDILARYFLHNDMSMADVVKTHSPSMDIQISSNFERLLFEMGGRDGVDTANRMAAFRAGGTLEVPDAWWRTSTEVFSGAAVSNEETLATIARVYESTGYLADPHTGVALRAAEALPAGESPVVTLSTAHPAKFPDAVRQATGVTPPLPAHLADLYDRTEQYDSLPGDLAAVQAHILDRLSERGLRASHP